MLRVLGAWLRAGEGIGWLAAGTMPNSLYRMPLVYLFLAYVFCYSCSFLFVVFVCFSFFFLFSLELGRCFSDLFLSSRPRTRLATTYITEYMVEARSVNVKKTTTYSAHKQDWQPYLVDAQSALCDGDSV